MKYCLPLEWLQPVKMSRIIAHWSAGAYRASDLDKEHYHFLVEGSGTVVRGDHTASDRVNTAEDDYAAHTRGCNTGSIDVSLACMAGAIESPFTCRQVPHAGKPVASNYGRHRAPGRVLSSTGPGHQAAGKWDFTRLPFAPNVIGAKACGDKMRPLTNLPTSNEIICVLCFS